jgi:hypothetical protein
LALPRNHSILGSANKRANYGVTVSVALLRIDPLQAEMVTAFWVGVNLVFAVNVADVIPAGTVTLLGTRTSNGLLLDRRTNTPPAGAGPLSVTVPVDGLPPLTVLPAEEAVIATLVVVVTALVLTVKEAVVDPALTVTLEGTVATPGLSLVSETTAPPLGAGPLRVTVPVDVPPPTTVVGLSVSADKETAEVPV